MSSTEFDYVVVGAGSAGCVVAARLSERPDLSVAVIEAGGSDRNPLFRVPLMTGVLLRHGYANWAYQTEPEPNLDNRRIFWPRGKVVGGSSSINGMVYTRGSPLDYDSWAQAGLPDWSWDRVLPVFKGNEHHWRGADEFHGAGGPLRIARPGNRHPLFDAFLDAGRQAGYRATDNFNGPTPEGFGHYDFNTWGGERWSSARAFLDPARERPNLTVLTHTHALRVIVERGRAAGVEVLVRGARRVLRARRAIVLCGGVVNSPTLLLHSGIGDADALRALGITVTHDLKGVGRNLQDHLLVRVEHACTQPITLHNLMRPDRALRELARAMLFKRGWFSTFPLEVGAFLRSDPALDAPDLQSHFLPGLTSMALRLPGLKKPKLSHDGHGFLANAYAMRPHSRGEITLRSADPNDPPVIRPNYLSAPGDILTLRAAVRILREVFAQRAFDPYRGPELSPGPELRTDAEIDAWIRRTADTVFHAVGTCRMGNGADSVVDGELRVHGLAGLRIADASVMPSVTSNNTHAPTVMIAEKAARYLAAAG
jgi:choline dehydrogenase